MRTMKAFIRATLCLSPFFFADAALAWWGRGYRPSAPWSCGIIGGWGWGWPGMIFGILFWILVCMAIFYLIRWIVHNTRRDRVSLSTASGPMDILKARYARGEITGDEFHRMRKDLQ